MGWRFSPIINSPVEGPAHLPIIGQLYEVCITLEAFHLKHRDLYFPYTYLHLPGATLPVYTVGN